MLSPRAVLITGANRGLGLEFVKQFLCLEQPPDLLFATCRTPENAEELQRIAKQNSKVKILKLDVNSQRDIDAAARETESHVGSRGLNLLINNAGISLKDQYVGNLTREDLLEQFNVNTISPLMITQSFLPLLLRAAEKMEGKAQSCNRAAIVNISSALGSISQNESGGMYGYRPTKAALNMITKSLHVELKNKGILVTSLHPGWVRTEMGGSNAHLSAEESVKACLNVMSKLDSSSSIFISYDGDHLPW